MINKHDEGNDKGYEMESEQVMVRREGCRFTQNIVKESLSEVTANWDQWRSLPCVVPRVACPGKRENTKQCVKNWSICIKEPKNASPRRDWSSSAPPPPVLGMIKSTLFHTAYGKTKAAFLVRGGARNRTTCPEVELCFSFRGTTTPPLLSFPGHLLCAQHCVKHAPPLSHLHFIVPYEFSIILPLLILSKQRLEEV